MKLRFNQVKATVNMIRYGEEGDKADHKVGTIYIKKEVVKELGDPKTIEVTIGKVG